MFAGRQFFNRGIGQHARFRAFDFFEERFGAGQAQSESALGGEFVTGEE